jgi:hypothetical protein
MCGIARDGLVSDHRAWIEVAAVRKRMQMPAEWRLSFQTAGRTLGLAVAGRRSKGDWVFGKPWPSTVRDWESCQSIWPWRLVASEIARGRVRLVASVRMADGCGAGSGERGGVWILMVISCRSKYRMRT